MQGGETEALNKNKLDTISCNDNNTQAPRQQPQDLASSGATNTTSSPPLPSGEPSPALHHLSNMALTDHQLLLALQQRNQMDNQSILRSQGSNSMDRESLMALAGQTPGAFGLGEGGGAMNDRVLLQLLNEQRQQELQRQALARELAERDYERSLLQRLGAIGGNPAALGLGSLGGLGLDPLGRSQGSAFEQARLSALLGGQLPGQIPSPLLQALNGLPQGGALGGTSLNRGPPGGTTVGFDDSITLEARSKQAFPLKLYRMLERAERNGQDDIISFIDDGKAFAIHKPRAFETDIMPSYFNSHRMSSFQRQLNIYGFERINDGIQKGAYRHKFFIKGKKELLDKIKRPQKLRNGNAATEDDEEATKLQTIAAEHLVGLSRTSGVDSIKSDVENKTDESNTDNAEKKE